MKNNGYKPRVPDIMEAVFDIGYLLFDLIAAVLFFVFSKGNSLFVLYGILTLTLCGGDAFHLLPQNRWCSDNGNQKLSIIRNAVFAVTGVGVIILYALSGNAHDYHLTRMVAAILISFGCYLPVTLMSKKHPKVGLLMIPKTCAYIWMIAMGLELLF